MMRRSSDSRAALIAVFALALGGCGQITFGAAVAVPDAGPTADVASDPPEAGSADTGPDVGEVDGGCDPVPDPPPPATWPFASGRTAWTAVFFESAPGVAGGSEPFCTNCHADVARQPSWKPLVPKRAEIAMADRFPRAINELWEMITTPGQAAATKLQSAHLRDGEFPRDHRYSVDEQMWLAEFVSQVMECRWVSTYAARPDGGGACSDDDAGARGDVGSSDSGELDGASTDAGTDAMIDDATPIDAGRLDSGATGSNRRCECALEPKDLRHCAL